ncbi:MAG: NAD(P)H-hydrate dehydratase, partial [Rhodospirillaceae bacterium]
VLVGPGAGVGAETRDKVLAALNAERAAVIDADGLTSFADDPKALFAALGPNHVLTPHEGEFARLFDADGERLDRARAAAVACGAVVLLKGADTVIAHPDGRAVVNTTGTPYLAIGGSGDVLAGMIAGLQAQGMVAFDAAAAAAWLHGRAAEALGPGLIAEDLVEKIPEILGEFIAAGV